MELYRNRDPLPEDVRDNQRRESIKELVDKFSGELYLTLLLLENVIDPTIYSNDGFNIVPRAAAFNAIAARHWYSTATIQPTNEPRVKRFASRLPGHYTVRGDWFLGIAKGSRSERLGWQAIDLLSSLPENVRRLQIGIGLPTRDFLMGRDDNDKESDDFLEEIPTALLSSDETGLESRLKYGEVIKLGASGSHFHWLFRSTIRSYGTHSRRWGKWLVRILKLWVQWREADSIGGNSFQLYDQLRQANEGKPIDAIENLTIKLESWKEFKKSLKVLAASLDTSPTSP